MRKTKGSAVYILRKAKRLLTHAIHYIEGSGHEPSTVKILKFALDGIWVDLRHINQRLIPHRCDQCYVRMHLGNERAKELSAKEPKAGAA